MSKLNRLIGLAQKAIDKAGSSQGSNGSNGAQNQGRPTGSGSGSTDWRSIVRTAADALTGDGKQQGSRPEQQFDRRPQDRRTYGEPRGFGQGAPGGAAGAGAAGAVAAGTGAAGTGAGNPAWGSPSAPPAAPTDPADRAAIARYDYLLQTADPHQIEQVHAEAFARLTPEQRAQIRARMNTELPEHERPRSDEAPDLARAAARTEASKPGLLRGLLARAGGSGAGAAGAGSASGQGAGRGRGLAAGVAGAGIGAVGGFAVGGLLTAVAGTAIVSSVAGPLLENAMNLGVDFDSLASGVDLEAIAGGVDVEGLTGGLGDAASGLGDQVSGFGEQLSGLGEGFEFPGLGNLFDR